MNDASEVATWNRRFVNLSEGEESASWISWDHEVAVNVNQIDDVALGVGTDFSRVTVLDPGPRAWSCDSCFCSC